MDKIASALRLAARTVDRAPTDAQKAAGNYRHGHVRLHGLDIAIENPKGGERSGVDKGGKRWSVKMPAHYGYVKRTEGKDGDAVDVYVGPEPDSNKVFIVDQVDAGSGKFDEHKCCLGYTSKEQALADYEKAFSDGKAKDRIGSVTTLSIDDFKGWLKDGDTTKPMSRKAYASGGSVVASALRIARKRADGGAVSDLYGETYKPDLGSDSEGDITTADMLARMKARDAGFPGALRDVARAIPHVEADDTSTASGIISRLGRTATEIPRSSLNTVANWLGRTPEIGPDTIAPLGLAPMGSLVGHSASLAKPSVADSARARYLEWKHPDDFPAISGGEGQFNSAKYLGEADRMARESPHSIRDARLATDYPRETIPSPANDGSHIDIAYLKELAAQKARNEFRLLSDQSKASLPGTVLNSLDQANASTRAATGLGHPDAVPGALETRGAFGKNPDMKPDQFSEHLAKKYGVDLDIVLTRNGDIRLQHIAVPKDKRGQGVGSSVMDEIARYADEQGKRVILNPAVKDDNFGTTSRSRLVDFYKRHGYVENKGRNKDFAISDGMFRAPREGSMGSDSSTRQQAKAPGAEPSIKSSGGSVGHNMHNPKIARALRTAGRYAEGGNVPLSDSGPVPGQEWPDTYDPQGGADFLGMLKDTGTGIARAIAPPIPGYNHPTLSEGAEALRAKVAGKSQGEVLREGLGEFAADAVPMVATSAFPLAGRALRAVGQGLARTPLTTGAAAAGLGMTALPGEAGESKGLSLPGLTPEQMTQYVEAERRIRTEKYRTGAERRSLEDTLRGLRELSNQTVLAERAAATQLKVRAGESEQDEYNRAVSRAERSRDTALARDRRFSDTAVGSAFDKAGGLAPGIAGVLTGGLSRLATGPSKVLYNYALPAVLGTLAGAGAANVPLAYNALVTEPDNPEKRAYEAYSRELPPSHPRKQEFGDYARGLPDANPIRKAASEEFYDPEKLTERLVMGGSEGLLGGEMGSAGVRIGGRAAKALAAAARGSGMRGDAARKLEGAAIDDVLPARSGTSGRPSQSNLPAAGPEGQVGSSQSLPALRNEGVASQSASVEPEIYILKPGRSGKTLHERGRFSSERAIRERLKKSKPPTDEDPPFAHGGIVRSALRIARKFGGRIGKSGGLLKSDVPGRTDHIETSVKSGSFVVPADTLSHLGESNTIAGARKLDQLLKSGPYGTSMGKSPSAGPKAQKALSMTKSKFASGGAVDVPILAAGGEYIIGPEQVAEIGGGDLDRGHAILDKFVLDVRNDHIATLQNLPGPQKD